MWNWSNASRVPTFQRNTQNTTIKCLIQKAENRIRFYWMYYLRKITIPMWYHFHLTKDLTITTDTFRKLAAVELLYRKANSSRLQDVLDDIFNTSRCICLRGMENPDEFKLLQNGIGKVRSFIHSEKNYSLDHAIVNASKAAYLSKLIEKGITEVHHFAPGSEQQLADATITEPLPTKFNKFKKSNVEAFFYWNEIQNIA